MPDKLSLTQPLLLLLLFFLEYFCQQSNHQSQTHLALFFFFCRRCCCYYCCLRHTRVGPRAVTCASRSGSGAVATPPNWPRSSQRDVINRRPISRWHLRRQGRAGPSRGSVARTRAERERERDCVALGLAASSQTALMTSPLHVLFLCPLRSAYTAEDSPRAKTINYACY